MFDGLARMLRAAPPSEAPSAPGQAPAGSPGAVPVLGESIRALDLSVRATTYLDLAGIRTIGAIVENSADDLLARPGFGRTSLREVRRKLAELDLSLREDAPAKPA